MTDSFETGGGLDLFTKVTNQSLVGTVVGAYRLGELIGTGGMGLVHKASRTDGRLGRDVAIKLIRPTSMPDLPMLQRFEAEGEILARLSHPNIAHIYDAGIESGMPFLVMEYIEGEPIDQFVARTKPDRFQVAELVIQICRALGFAHDHLVIHRDIKPSNVLVNTEDVVKLLDFGIAKSLDSQGDTETTQQLLTPKYASPEQMLGLPMNVRSDVYQVGALLYELLGGNLALSIEAALKRALSEEDFRLAPSSVVDKDLRAIIEQCMHREPQHRYESVHMLRADLGNWRAGLPVSARPSSVLIRTRKWIKRNRGLSAAGFVIVAVVVGGFYSYTAGLAESQQRAQAEQRNSAAVANFLTAIFEQSDPNQHGGEEPSASDLLVLAVGRIQEELAHQPQVQLQLLTRIAAVFYSRSEYASALEAAERAQEVLRNTPELGHPLLDESASIQATALIRLDSIDEATQLADQMLLIAREHNADDQLLRGLSVAAMARLHHSGFREAEPFLREAVTTIEEKYGKFDERLSKFVGNLGFLDWRRGRYEDAQAWFERALDVRELSHGRLDLVVAHSLHNIGASYSKRGMPTSALKMFKEELTIIEQLHPESDDYAGAQRSTAKALVRLGRVDKGLALAKNSLALLERLQVQPNRILASLEGVLVAETELGHFQDADRTAQQMLHIVGQLREEDDERAEVYAQVAFTRLRQGRYAQALELFVRAEQWWTEVFGVKHIENARIQMGIGQVYAALGDTDGAQSAWQRALEIWEQQRVTGSIDYAHTLAKAAGLTQVCPTSVQVRAAREAVLAELPEGHPTRVAVVSELNRCN